MQRMLSKYNIYYINILLYTTFLLQTVWSDFNRCDVIGPKICGIQWSNAKNTAIMFFKVIEGRTSLDQWKARMQLPISE